MVNSKQKGGSFERKICKQLSLWITDGKRDDVFWRSAMSGGRATVHGKKNRQAADICAVQVEGNQFADDFIVEVKHYAELEFFGMLQGTGKLYRFWEIVKGLAVSREKFPMLICKQNYLPEFVLLSKAVLPRLGLIEKDCCGSFPRYGVYIIHLSTMMKVGDANELWKPLVDWDTYEISNKGRLRHRIMGGSGYSKSKIVGGMAYVSTLKRGVHLQEDGRKLQVSMASLVLNSFVGPPPTEYGTGKGCSLARHLDDCEWNNTLRNLAWGNKSDNTQDAIKNGRRVYITSNETREKIRQSWVRRRAKADESNNGASLERRVSK
jgi:hypothetical protein